MKKLVIAAAAALVAVSFSGAMVDAAPKTKVKAPANCVTKAGRGTGGDDASASFQAWEAVLQATDWGMWAVWITSSSTVGQAPGYKVTNVKKKCVAGGGLGRQCTIQAALCK